MEWLKDWLGEILLWLLDVLLWAPKKLYELICDGLASVIEAIPAPSWLTGANPFASIDPGIVYFGEALQLGEGVTIILSAYLLRFVIRRIPLIG